MFDVQKYFCRIFGYCTPVYIQITRKDGLKALLVSKFCKVQPRNAFNNIVSWWLKESGRALVVFYVQSVPFENYLSKVKYSNFLKNCKFTAKMH